MKKTRKMPRLLYDHHREINITIILLNAETNSNVFIDSGGGNNHKLLCIQATTLTTNQSHCWIVRFHWY